MMTKIRLMGQAGKAVSYMFLALNQTSRFASGVARNIGNGIRNKGLFNITLIAESGVALKELENQTTSQISDILEQMDNFGIYSITIEKATGRKDDN